MLDREKILAVSFSVQESQCNRGRGSRSGGADSDLPEVGEIMKFCSVENICWPLPCRSYVRCMGLV